MKDTIVKSKMVCATKQERMGESVARVQSLMTNRDEPWRQDAIDVNPKQRLSNLGNNCNSSRDTGCLDPFLENEVLPDVLARHFRYVTVQIRVWQGEQRDIMKRRDSSRNKESSADYLFIQSSLIVRVSVMSILKGHVP